MLQIIEGANAEGFLLTPDRYGSGFELRLPDTLGDGGGKYCCFETCCVASSFDTEYSSGVHFLYDKDVISFMPQ